MTNPAETLSDLQKRAVVRYFMLGGVYVLLDGEKPLEAVICPLCASAEFIYSVIDDVTRPYKAAACYECAKKGKRPPPSMPVYASTEYYTDTTGPYPVKKRKILIQPADKQL